MVDSGPLGPVPCLDCGGWGCSCCKHGRDPGDECALAAAGMRYAYLRYGQPSGVLVGAHDAVLAARVYGELLCPTPGRTTVLPAGVDYRPLGGTPALTCTESAALDVQAERDIAAHPEYDAGLRSLREQVLATTGVPPAYLTVGGTIGTDDADGGAPRPYALGRDAQAWVLDDDGVARKVGAEHRPPTAALVATTDREIAAAVAEGAVAREREIRAELADAHEHAAGARLPDPADQPPDLAAERLTATGNYLAAARRAERAERADVAQAFARLRRYTRRRAYGARLLVGVVVADIMLFFVGPTSSAVLAAISVAAMILVFAYAPRHSVNHRLMEKASNAYADAHAALVTAETEYLLAGGDPDTFHDPGEPPARSWPSWMA